MIPEKKSIILPLFLLALIAVLIGAGTVIFFQHKHLAHAIKAKKQAEIDAAKSKKNAQTTETPPSQQKLPNNEPSLPDGSAVPKVIDGYDPTLSDLGTPPDWQTLDLWQETITHDDFLRLITQVYSVDDSWKKFISIHKEFAIIRTNRHIPNAFYKLKFSQFYNDSSPARSWQSIDDLPPASSKKPLSGLRIAIDPGHIGGDFAKMEERWFKIGSKKPVKEGDLTLLTAKILKRKLIALGAKCYLTRGKNAPVNHHRPEDYKKMAQTIAKHRGLNDAASIQKIQNRLFYRTGEIRARARRINLAFRPDLVLCLHFNAEAWADPNNPTLTKNNHYHILLHGALTKNEMAHDDERYQMISKILQHNHDQEQGLGIFIAKSLAEATGLPAYNYSPLSRKARKIQGADGMWARNLLANRLYNCPVIYLEPYVMNNQDVFDRIQRGNYTGLQNIHGVKRKSIFKEYADAVADGIKSYYLSNRIIYKPNKSH